MFIDAESLKKVVFPYFCSKIDAINTRSIIPTPVKLKVFAAARRNPRLMIGDDIISTEAGDKVESNAMAAIFVVSVTSRNPREPVVEGVGDGDAVVVPVDVAVDELVEVTVDDAVLDLLERLETRCDSDNF